MDKDQLIEIAQQRAEEENLTYAGALLPQEAYQLLQQDPTAKLIDVRTQAERDWVGYIKGAIAIEWETYPEVKLNEGFIPSLEQHVQGDEPLLFICRNARRSDAAAAAAARIGFSNAYNVLEGFEGEPDPEGHRGTQMGWKFRGLPWQQD